MAGQLVCEALGLGELGAWGVVKFVRSVGRAPRVPCECWAPAGLPGRPGVRGTRSLGVWGPSGCVLVLVWGRADCDVGIQVAEVVGWVGSRVCRYLRALSVGSRVRQSLAVRVMGARWSSVCSGTRPFCCSRPSLVQWAMIVVGLLGGPRGGWHDWFPRRVGSDLGSSGRC